MTSIDDLLAIPEAALKPRLAPGIHQCERDRRPTSEYERQRFLISFIRKYCPRLFVFAVPNATRGDWSKLRQQREGAVYGATDLVVTWSGGVAFIEMKDGMGKPDDRQIEFMNRLHWQGHHVALCRSMDGAIAWLRSIGAPVPEVRG